LSLFEIVYIQHNDAERFTLLPGCLDLAFKEFQKISMVEYIGQLSIAMVFHLRMVVGVVNGLGGMLRQDVSNSRSAWSEGVG